MIDRIISRVPKADFFRPVVAEIQLIVQSACFRKGFEIFRIRAPIDFTVLHCYDNTHSRPKIENMEGWYAS